MTPETMPRLSDKSPRPPKAPHRAFSIAFNVMEAA